METLILKLGATGDVVRTTTLLRALPGPITWLTERKNTPLLRDLEMPVRCFEWEEREQCRDRAYDLIINLEDTQDVADFVDELDYRKIWGAHSSSDNTVSYSADSRGWFDLSIISRHGRQRADELKLRNRATYQELIFAGLGLHFTGEAYCLPVVTSSPLTGDIAIAPEAGPVWPMKKWAYYAELKEELEGQGFVVNILPKRASLLEHLADVQGHRCLVSGDSLPMHLALGSGVKCVSIFNCTSPWEIYGYGLQTKLISPLLEEYFYRRGYEEAATAAIPLSAAVEAVMAQMGCVPAREE